MTPDDYTDRAAHHRVMAGHYRQNTASMLSYLDWSTDEDERAWATSLAAAYSAMAAAERRYADALTARVGAAA